MDAVVGAVREQLDEVRERARQLREQLTTLAQVKSEIKKTRATERKLLAALASLEGTKTGPSRARRRGDDNEKLVREFLSSKSEPSTLTEISRGTKLPLSSVRHVLLRMADVSVGRGRLWSLVQ